MLIFGFEAESVKSGSMMRGKVFMGLYIIMGNIQVDVFFTREGKDSRKGRPLAKGKVGKV